MTPGQTRADEMTPGQIRAQDGAPDPAPPPRATKIFIVAFFTYELLYLVGAFSTRYFFLLSESHRAISLSLIIILTLLMKRGRADRQGPPAAGGTAERSVPWYDYALMIAGCAGCFYIAPTSKIVELQLASPVIEPLELTLGIVTIAVLLEGTRRVAGPVLPVVLVAALLYALFANQFPGLLYGRAHSFPRVIGEVYLSLDGIFGNVMRLWTRILVVFLLFGGFLHASGAGRFFIELALALAGHLRGGPAKVATIASGLFGTVSGSAAADVATTGVITIPMMKRLGYPPEFAGAVEAVASTGGVLMPPMMGMVAFMVAEYLDMPYIEVCIAAALPALLYYGSLYLLVDLESRRLDLRGIPPSELPSLTKTLKEGWFFFIPLLVVVYALAVLRYPPGLCAIYGLVALVVVTSFKRETRFTAARTMEAFMLAARSSLVVAIICGSVGILIASVTMTGATLRMGVLLVESSGDSLLALLLLAGVASLLLGTGVPAIASYPLLAVTVAPAITSLGVPPIAAHLFVLYWGVSHLITPPVGGTLYIAASFSGVGIWRQGAHAMRLGIALFLVPFIFCYHPELLFVGELPQTAIQFVLAALAMVSVAGSFSGSLEALSSPVSRAGLLGMAAGLIVQGTMGLFIGFGALGAVVAGVLLRSARYHSSSPPSRERIRAIEDRRVQPYPAAPLLEGAQCQGGVRGQPVRPLLPRQSRPDRSRAPLPRDGQVPGRRANSDHRRAERREHHRASRLHRARRDRQRRARGAGRRPPRPLRHRGGLPADERRRRGAARGGTGD